MTSASQLGILHGTNEGIPAFRWFERDRQKLMQSSNPSDAAEIVRRASNGEGLLSNNGVSICNLVTGDATRAYMTTAAIAEGSSGVGDSQTIARLFFNPSGYLRAFTLFLGEIVTERIQARRTRRAGTVPRLDRGFKYAVMRAGSNVVLRDINVALIIEEMYRGANVIYADFTDYDEIAHHSGPERVEALQALDGVDAAIATIAKAAEDAPRPYRFIVLSDHGQSLGSTFKQRHGQSLGDVVRGLMGGRAVVAQTDSLAEGSAPVNALLSELIRSKGATAALARAATADRTSDGFVDVEADSTDATPADEASIVVVGSGNLGLVYFTGFDHRLTIEELEALHPNLVGSLAAHPGVSMVLVKSEERGGLLLGPRGVVTVSDGRVEGDDPLANFGPNALAGIRREDAMPHAPDLLLISQFDPELGEVAAFEEQIGSHGGLGGAQSEPFILHPVEWELDEPSHSEHPRSTATFDDGSKRLASSSGLQAEGFTRGEDGNVDVRCHGCGVLRELPPGSRNRSRATQRMPAGQKVPQWIGIAWAGRSRVRALAAPAGSRCPPRSRGPQPHTGRSARSRRVRPISSIASKRPVSPAKYTRWLPSIT